MIGSIFLKLFLGLVVLIMVIPAITRAPLRPKAFWIMALMPFLTFKLARYGFNFAVKAATR